MGLCVGRQDRRFQESSLSGVICHLLAGSRSRVTDLYRYIPRGHNKTVSTATTNQPVKPRLQSSLFSKPSAPQKEGGPKLPCSLSWGDRPESCGSPSQPCLPPTAWGDSAQDLSSSKAQSSPKSKAGLINHSELLNLGPKLLFTVFKL